METELTTPEDSQYIIDALKRLLFVFGENPERQGLAKTPERLIRMYEEFLRPSGKIKLSVFDNPGYDQMVVVKDIQFVSLCEHHLLPFWGVAHIGYLPLKYVVGLSKLARIVDYHAKRLQIQERLTEQIAHYIHEAIGPSGVGVVLEAEHSCISFRGVQKPGHKTITSSLQGDFRNAETREEFLWTIRH